MNIKYSHKIFFTVMATALVLVGAGCRGNTSTDANYTGTSDVNNASTSAEGKVIFSITDAATNMNGITAVNLTVDKIEMQGEASGWVTVSNEVMQYDLLKLKAKEELALAAQTAVPEGAYNQVRLHVKKITVVKSGVEAEAKLPSNTLQVKGKFTVKQGSTTSVKLDFVADESLHLTGNGKFIFTPVVKLESRTNANVSVGADNIVIVSGGSVESNPVVGMDVDGTVRDDFKLDANEKLEINEDDVIKLNRGNNTSSAAGLKLRVINDD
jgi:hypothetical protein